MNASALQVVTGVSSLLGLLSLIVYVFYYIQRQKKETSIRKIVEGEGLFNAGQIIDILREFTSDDARLEALRNLGDLDVQRTERVYKKIKEKIDIESVMALSHNAFLKRMRVAAILFIGIALLAFIYSLWVDGGSGKELSKIRKGLVKLVSASYQAPFSFTWRTGDPNPDCDNACKARLTPNGYTVNHLKDGEFVVTRRFRAVCHCDASPNPICRPVCDGNGDVSATAHVDVGSGGLIMLKNISVNSVGCNCLHKSRGDGYLRATVKSLDGQTIDMS